MYGIVHTIWKFIKFVANRVEQETRDERNRIIEWHVKAGHKDRLKACNDPTCLKLRTPELEPVVQPEHYHSEL